MTRVIGLILLALGVMMLVLAPLLKFYVLPSAAKTPVDQYTESTSNVVFEQLLKLLEGTGDKDFFPGSKHEPGVVTIGFATDDVGYIHDGNSLL